MEDYKIKYLLLLPVRYNDGRSVAQETMDRILDELFELADGYSVAGPVKGAYKMRDGLKQEDESLQVWVAVAEEDVSELRTLVAKIGKELGQETMYLERTGGTIDFIPPAP